MCCRGTCFSSRKTIEETNKMDTKSDEQLGCHLIGPYMDKFAATEKLHDFTYIVKSDAKAGGYMGVLNRVTLKGKRSDETNASYSIIYKDQPSDEMRRELFRTGIFFENEAVFYNFVLPAFEKLQDEKGIQGADRFVSYPKCYFAGEVIILEDLSPVGFKMANRQKPLDLAHCRLVMKEMGKLHAFSFAMRDQKPKEFARLAAKVKEVVIVPVPEGMPDHWGMYSKRAYEKYNEIAPKDSKYSSTLKRYCDNCFEMMKSAIDGKAAEPYSVITHGDCWTNNYLFKYAEESNSVEAMRFLDFQLARYSSSVCDIMYFISCCTSQETRAQHYDDLLKEYHNSLSSFLQKLGSDPERLFPFSALKDQLQRFGSFGMGMAIIALPVVADSPDAGPDLDNLDFAKMSDFGASENPAVWKRLTDLVDDMVDFGYIK